ncbi:uncharacterized protein DUF4331 [Kribbella orskensis]|uniref:Uncharacterized protein DUF4331 n=1 Tax=Kribbella orskensis TaxID=2512216 RepID=A0ABY2BR29_9ACTN|nr:MULTISPECIES: DUF4331 domain-containing protein [Kribbella]TCN42122.1 uncharacterized protein DUF4331 [Kribbella sp. VKM Ac-2500]TCO26000.1 uncharacterized protein DUF4331 [Kribbella orskensis]
MSSHREAPEISKDPVADNTDVYAFVSPDKPDTVTLIANFIPFQNPYGGPNFYEFGDDVLYQIHISNSGTGRADISYQFRFHAEIRNRKTFLYNTGPITSIKDKTWNRPQYYSVTRVENGRARVLARNLGAPPVNVGVRSTPNYARLGGQAIYTFGTNRKVFAGQRADGFFADLGSIFDLATLRPFQMAHLIPSAAAMGVNGLQGSNVHTIALQVPITDLTRDGKRPKDVLDPKSVIGVYASASRRQSRILNGGVPVGHGPYKQVSRLGNPLFNEVVVPMAEKDKWNSLAPAEDKRFAKYVTKPELGGLLPVLYPGVFPNLAAYKKPRADLAAILLTGIPKDVIPGFQNFTGPVQADMLRLNVAVPPAKSPNPLGLVAGDAAGFPNGRRVFDDVVTVELRAIAGLTIPLVDKAYKPDAAAGAIKDGTSNTNSDYLTSFPYLGTPAGGSQSRPGIPAAS